MFGGRLGSGLSNDDTQRFLRVIVAPIFCLYEISRLGYPFIACFGQHILQPLECKFMYFTLVILLVIYDSTGISRWVQSRDPRALANDSQFVVICAQLTFPIVDIISSSLVRASTPSGSRPQSLCPVSLPCTDRSRPRTIRLNRQTLSIGPDPSIYRVRKSLTRPVCSQALRLLGSSSGPRRPGRSPSRLRIWCSPSSEGVMRRQWARRPRTSVSSRSLSGIKRRRVPSNEPANTSS